jgi:O-antigen ligase
MLHVHVTWFSNKNARPGLTRLTVTGTPAETTPLKAAPPAADVSLETPGRLKLWSIAWQMFQDRPLLGIGPDTYQANYALYAHEEKFAPHAHNLWLGWLAGTGLIGFVAFLWMTWRLLQFAWRGRQRQKKGNPLWIWWLALLAGMISLFTHGFVDGPYAILSVYLAFWIVAGLTLSIAAPVTVPALTRPQQ